MSRPCSRLAVSATRPTCPSSLARVPTPPERNGGVDEAFYAPPTSRSNTSGFQVMKKLGLTTCALCDIVFVDRRSAEGSRTGFERVRRSVNKRSMQRAVDEEKGLMRCLDTAAIERDRKNRQQGALELLPVSRLRPGCVCAPRGLTRSPSRVTRVSVNLALSPNGHLLDCGSQSSEDRVRQTLLRIRRPRLCLAGRGAAPRDHGAFEVLIGIGERH